MLQVSLTACVNSKRKKKKKVKERGYKQFCRTKCHPPSPRKAQTPEEKKKCYKQFPTSSDDGGFLGQLNTVLVVKCKWGH